jgi:uncharacterized membrane protein
MRRKSFTLTSLLVCLLVSSGMPVGSSAAQAHQVIPVLDCEALAIPLKLPEPTWEPASGYILLRQEGCPGYVRVAGAPLVPFWGKMLPFPVGTRILGASLENAVYEEHVINKRVLPAPPPVPLVDGACEQVFEGPSYSESELYPSTETDIAVTTGMGEAGGVEAHLFLKVFPVRYNPVSGLVRELRSADVVVRYHSAPAPAQRANETYDLLILTPPEFENEMGRYKSHKEELGFSARMVNLTSVYSGSIFNVSGGRDNPERIKLFIKGALENWSVRYVVLTGDVDKFPVRRAYFLDYYDSSDLPTDLYYEDIYKAGTKTFCNWDKDGDNLFAECYPSTNPDAIDIDPDVTVGRLPVGSVAELSGYINKTISYYENVTTGDWFRNVTLVGTDTFGPSRGETSGVAEGEYACDVAFSYLNASKGFNATRFYELNHTFSITNIRDCLNRGEGFAIFANHGSTDGICYPDSGGGPGLSGGTAAALTNGPKYPLSVLDACSTHAIDSNDCLGEDLVLNARGGAIASVGATRVAYGGWSTWHIRGNSGYINVHLAEIYNKGTIMPGVLLDRTKQSYMANVGIYDYADMKTMCQYIQLGDPVAFIGGAGIEAAPDVFEKWVDPGQMAQFRITLQNTAMHSDSLQLALSGARWAAGLNTSQVALPANASAEVTLRVNVDALAGAYESSTVTVNVIPRSTGIPVRLNLTTKVNCLRKLSFSVNDTRFSAFPGQNISLGYSVQNGGNIFENVTLAADGGDSAWKLSTSPVPFEVARRTTFNGTIEIPVPERCLAGVYRFRLALSSESGLADEAAFEVAVHKTYGFSARPLNDNATAGASGAMFDVAVSNLGNHPDSCELSLSEMPASWTGEASYPMDLSAYGESVQRITVVPDGRALAGDYPMLLRLGASWGTLQTDVLTATVERRSDLRFSVPERSQTVDAGSDACFRLGIESRSNFPENVKLDVQRLPDGWSWFLASAPLDVGPFSNAPGAVVLQVPAGAPAGHYTMDVVASTTAWKSLSGVSVEVRERRSFSARLDSDQAVLRPGESRTFSVKVQNGGNCEDNYLLSADSDLPVYFPKNLAGVRGGSSDDFLFVVTASGNARSGVFELSLSVSSVSDPSLVRRLTVRIKVEKISDLQVEVEERSGASPGTTGVFWLSASNSGSEAETVTLSAPGLSAWGLELPGLTVQPGETLRAPVFYKVPEGIDGGSFELSIVATSADRSWSLSHQVDVPAPPVVPVQGSAARQSPSLLPAILGGVVLIVVAAALALFFRSRGKDRQAAPPLLPASSAQQVVLEQPAPEPQAPVAPPPSSQTPIPPRPWQQDPLLPPAPGYQQPLLPPAPGYQQPLLPPAPGYQQPLPPPPPWHQPPSQ